MTSGDSDEQQPGLWQKIWKLNLPQRMRTLDLLVTSEKILTNKLRVKRRMFVDVVCSRYPQVIETQLHVFRDCYMAKRIWLQLVDPR